MASLAWAFFLLLPLSALAAKQTYIVRMNHNQKPQSYLTHEHWYTAKLQSLSVDATENLLYNYNTAFRGFAVALDLEQAEALRQSESVLGVYADTVYELHTTRSPRFLGLDVGMGLWEGHSNQDLDEATQDVIVGVLDTGVWPESESFRDVGMPEIPSRWKGECEAAVDFSPKSCNRKLIGARSFSKGSRMASAAKGETPEEKDSPRDVDGHGTHTASTAAGSAAANASLLGYATGTARGMATRARVAAYKVCWNSGCFGSDILAGIEKAMTDGVDVLSLSLGGGSAPYFRDPIAIGAFAAVAQGIFVACSAGNSGPEKDTLANVAPWIATIGAGTLDRDFPAYAVLGNGQKHPGVSLYSGKGMGVKSVGLVYKIANSSNMCLPGSLDPKLVRGKVVLCDRGISARVEKGLVVRDAGGIGMILANTEANGEELVADSHLLPAVAVGRKVGDMIRDFVRSARNPTALLSFGGTLLEVHPSPVVAAFSSRGPNTLTPEIFKPDVIGPGVNILAAWTGAMGPTGLAKDPRRTKFNIMSGTSMSCPHISGVAALLKAAHPTWSPSAIKSALVTTAYTVDNTKSPLRDAADGSLSSPLAHGSGYVDPLRALSPGLIYDITTDDYTRFLCSLGYTVQQVQLVSRRPNVTCRRKLSNPGNLNYPSFSVQFKNSSGYVKYGRQLTNVGAAGSVYDATVEGPASVAVVIRPKRLVFREVGDRLKYSVTFVPRKKAANPMGAFGSITWSSKQHQVRSPVAYSWV